MNSLSITEINDLSIIIENDKVTLSIFHTHNTPVIETELNQSEVGELILLLEEAFKLMEVCKKTYCNQCNVNWPTFESYQLHNCRGPR